MQQVGRALRRAGSASSSAWTTARVEIALSPCTTVTLNAIPGARPLAPLPLPVHALVGCARRPVHTASADASSWRESICISVDCDDDKHIHQHLLNKVCKESCRYNEMSVLMLPVLLMVAGMALTHADMIPGIDPQLKIAAWNMNRFGVTKMSNPKVVEIIVQVIRRYDIIVLLEVTDYSNGAVAELLEKLNSNTAEPYSLTISERVGRSSYKEQYAFYWRPSRVSVEKAFLFNDSKSDVFQYDPFIIIFNTNLPDVPKFAIIAIHAKPTDAPNEMDSLVDIYDEVKTNHSTENVFLMGDMNAGCTYVTSSDWDDIRLHTNPLYIWLISGHADTTTTTTSCPYDRIVMRGAALSRNTYNNSAGAFYYDENYGITEDLAQDVSNHYPVEVSLRGHVSPGVEGSTTVRLGVEVSTEVAWEHVEAMVQNLLGSESKYTVHSSTGAAVVVQWSLTYLNKTLESLKDFSTNFQKVLTSNVLSVLHYKLKNKVLTDTSLYGASLDNSKMIQVTILCLFASTECTTSVTSQTTIN